MICPHCNEPIDDAVAAKALGSKGGAASSRSLSSEQAKAMVAAREAKREAEFRVGDTVEIAFRENGKRRRLRAQLVCRTTIKAEGGWMINREIDATSHWNEDAMRLVRRAS